MDSLVTVRALLKDILTAAYESIAWEEAGHLSGKYSVYNALVLMESTSMSSFVQYDAKPDLSEEDPEPLPGVLDPWGQPKLEMKTRVVEHSSAVASFKSASPDQLSTISESRRKSHYLGRRLTSIGTKKSSSVLRMASSKHGSDVSRLDEEGKPSARNGKKQAQQPGDEQFKLQLQRNEDGYSE